MTETNRPTTDTNPDDTSAGARAPINRRLALTLAGAGLAGAAVVAGGSRASAINGEPVLVGGTAHRGYRNDAHQRHSECSPSPGPRTPSAA